MAEVVLLLEYLHSNGIVYRNIKPENLFIDSKGHIKLCEFFFAKYIFDRTFTTCGTPDYMAPEILHGSGHSFEVDWWAAGVLMFEMLSGYTPFPDAGENCIRDSFTILFPPNFNPEAEDLIKRFLVSQPDQRIGAVNGILEIKLHPFFTSPPAIDWIKMSYWDGIGPFFPAPIQTETENYPIRDGFDLTEEYIVQMMESSESQNPQFISSEIQAFFDCF